MLSVIDQNVVMWCVTVFKGGSGAQLPPVLHDVMLCPQRKLDGAHVCCFSSKPGDVYDGG